MYIFTIKIALSIHFYLVVAIATVHRSIFAGLERYFGLFTALRTYCGEHLASGFVAIATIPITFCLPGFAACGTALGFVGIAFGCEELLFLGTESKGSATIGTLE